MVKLEEHIHRLTCKFNDNELENQYKEMKWEKNSNYIWNLMLLGHIIFLLIILDDINQLGVQPIYISVHIICSISVYILLFYEEYRKNYYDIYFTLIIPLLMVNGAYHYYMDQEALFGPGAAALPLLTLLFFTIYPVDFINSFFIVLTTVAAFLVYLLDVGVISGEQIPYLLVIPFIYGIFVKRSNEFKSRIDYMKTEELKILRVKAQNASKAKSDFLANMSHEIRTPMNAIIGFSDLMLGEALREEQKSHLTTINRSARSLLHLLNDILDSAKLDKGKLDLDYRDFLIREELDLVISTFWLEAKRKKVGLVLNVDDSVANGYRGVPERMRQVLNNLIGNAVKFTHEGEVTINVKSDEKFVYFDVTDTGIGMTQEQVERVFDPFSQADASMSRKYGGTGLGTTISKQLVELMGGNICATSEKGKGTTFTFRLPLEVVEIDDYVSSELSSKAARIETSLTVLVVDDVQQNLELLSLLLKRAGHIVETATDGQIALDKMRAKSFDVVLMDLRVPE